MPPDDRAIAISATFTAEALQPALSFWNAELGLDLEIRFAGYNQLFQQLLDPAELFSRNRAGFNVALVRLDDWLAVGAAESAQRLVDAVRAFASPVIVAVCPPAPGNEAGCAEAARLLRENLDGLIEPEPVAEIHDLLADKLGHVPYTPLFFASLATAIARKIHALSHSPYKVIALDCDETLWAGICGEDGPQGVTLDAPRLALQEFMAQRRSDGMLLALCSKNNEEDVIETFRAHPEMPLRLEDFAARRINWESKAANLTSLADELELGLDSFILVDDNPKECTEAQAVLPEVLALPLPAHAPDIPEFLRHVWAFDRGRVTEEDRRRPELYARRAERAKAEQSAANLEEFLESLRLEIVIAPMRADQVARVAQLTQRTNQMNVSCIRRTEAEIQALDAECLTVDVKDRFGDYGLTGVVIFRPSGDALVVDTFLLSCRILGRGVEHRMLARLNEIAAERGLARVEIPFVPSQRNRPAALFLESVGRAGRPAPTVPGTARVPTPTQINYLKIATDLRDPQAVLNRLHAAPPKPTPTPSDPPRTELEGELAALWAELLHLSAVGVHDNFFNLGGHSLLAVQLLSRVRQIHGVELSLEVVYSGDFTVAELAEAVERKQIEQAGGDYRDLLEELEALSDEEARTLLAAELDAS